MKTIGSVIEGSQARIVLFVDCRNNDSTSGAQLLVSATESAAGWRLTEFLRVDNVGDRNSVGSVIVNEANRRYYEPAPRRSMTVGIQAALTF